MKRLTRAAAVVAAALALGACAPEPVPTLEPVPSPTAPMPALGEEQLAEIIAEAEAGLVEADAASTTAALDARFTGPAHIQRAAEYAYAAASGGSEPVTPMDLDPYQSIVTASFDWPRAVTVISEIPEGSNLRLLYTMVQTDPRSDFKVWGWVRLFPGMTLPQVATSELGSRYITPDDTSLLVAPAELMERYADVVNNGDASEYVGLFQPDSFRAGWDTNEARLAESVADAGTVTQSVSPSESGTFSIGTADGGAIVLGVLDMSTVLQRTVADATLTAGDRVAYFGETDVVGTLTTSYYATVAFYVPPAGSDAQIQVLGAEQVITGAERDDSTNPD